MQISISVSYIPSSVTALSRYLNLCSCLILMSQFCSTHLRLILLLMTIYSISYFMVFSSFRFPLMPPLRDTALLSLSVKNTAYVAKMLSVSISGISSLYRLCKSGTKTHHYIAPPFNFSRLAQPMFCP